MRMSAVARLLTLLVALVVWGPHPIAANVPTFSHWPVAIFEYDAGRVSAYGYDDRPEDADKSFCPVACAAREVVVLRGIAYIKHWPCLHGLPSDVAE
jgi:hypothetical protein